VTNLAAGTYRIHVASDAGNNRGRVQLACGPVGGSLVDVGAVQDTYSPTNVIYYLHTNSISSTALSTNLLREFNCGVWTAPSNGNYTFRFTVVDKNAASSGYALAFDYLKFTPATAANTAAAPSLDAFNQGGLIVLSWPSNAQPYQLESATNFSALEWQAASPGPTLAETNYFVTNTTDGGQKFYRLRRL
jgi:hypothetical protein